MKENLMMILGVDTNENVWSNLYAYLLNPRESHGMGGQFMQAFIKLLQSKIKSKNVAIPDFKYYTIQREVKVNENKEGRIDLLIREGHNCLIIENKVYHTADNNPFSDYYKSIKDDQANKYIILITIHRSEYLMNDILLRINEVEAQKDEAESSQITAENIINITHSELAAEFSPIVESMTNVKEKYLLKDFISNIEKLSDPMKYIEEFFKHRDEINRCVKIAHATKEYLYNTLSDKYLIKKINTLLPNNKGLVLVDSGWKAIQELRRYIRFQFSGSDELILGISLESIWQPFDGKPKLTISLQPDGKWFEIARNQEKEIREVIGKYSELNCNPIDDRGWWHCAEKSCELQNDEIKNRATLQDKAFSLISENGFLELAEELFNLLNGTNSAE